MSRLSHRQAVRRRRLQHRDPRRLGELDLADQQKPYLPALPGRNFDQIYQRRRRVGRIPRQQQLSSRVSKMNHADQANLTSGRAHLGGVRRLLFPWAPRAVRIETRASSNRREALLAGPRSAHQPGLRDCQIAGIRADAKASPAAGTQSRLSTQHHADQSLRPGDQLPSGKQPPSRQLIRRIRGPKGRQGGQGRDLLGRRAFCLRNFFNSGRAWPRQHDHFMGLQAAAFAPKRRPCMPIPTSRRRRGRWASRACGHPLPGVISCTGHGWHSDSREARRRAAQGCSTYRAQAALAGGPVSTWSHGAPATAYRSSFLAGAACAGPGPPAMRDPPRSCTATNTGGAEQRLLQLCLGCAPAARVACAVPRGLMDRATARRTGSDPRLRFRGHYDLPRLLPPDAPAQRHR